MSEPHDIADIEAQRHADAAWEASLIPPMKDQVVRQTRTSIEAKTVCAVCGGDGRGLLVSDSHNRLVCMEDS